MASEAENSDPQTVRGDRDAPDWEKLERILGALPPGIPILPPEDARNFSKYRHKPRVYAKEAAWKICTGAMEKYDAELCRAHREEIDTLLVFAGLFSAVVTGFALESYQWLQDDPNDALISVLAQIARSVQHNSTAVDASAPARASGLGRAAS